jgi:hypothetical protein
LGTAISSSNWFGGRGAFTRSRVQVSSTRQTETGTVFPTEQQASWSRQGQLLPCYIPDVDVRGAFEQGVEVRIVRGLGIGCEDRGVHLNVDFGADIGQATATFTLHEATKAAPPQIFPMASGLQLPRYRYRTNQVQIQPFKCRIVGLKLSHRPDRSPLKVPDVHSQHSRLT